MNDMPGFARAQQEYDNRTPPEDAPSECAECNGNGHVQAIGDPDGDHVECWHCKGFGLLDARGEPFDPHKAERDACDYADMQRDEQLTREREPIDQGDYE